MQKAISILLVFCILLQAFSKLSIIATYELNKDFISKVLCINKQEPASQCEGKCYLTKKLEQAEKHEHLPSGDIKLKVEILFIQHIANFHFVGLPLETTAASFYPQLPYTSPLISVFTPPKI